MSDAVFDIDDIVTIKESPTGLVCRMVIVEHWHKWADCSATGYHKDVPPWLAVWLLIIVDNAMHIGINALALRYL